MSEQKRYFARAMRRVAQTCGLTLILLISISPLMFGHALRAQAFSVGTESTVPLDEIDPAASTRLSRLVQENPNDQLLNELRREVAALGLRLTVVEEELQETRAAVRTAQRTSLVALFIVILVISGSFGLQWGIMKRSRTSGLVFSAEGRGHISTLPERRNFSVNPKKLAAGVALIIFVISFFLPATEIGFMIEGVPVNYKVPGYEAARNLMILPFANPPRDPWSVLRLVLAWPANFLLATGFVLVFLDKTKYAKYVVAYAVAGQSYWGVASEIRYWLIGYWMWLLSGISLFIITVFAARRRAVAT